MPVYQIPGVYIEEIPKFPPSVAQVPTAIPAFMGRTEITTDMQGNSLINKAVRIGSQKEYEQVFGFGPAPAITHIDLDADNNFIGSDLQILHYLYDSVRLFYANGGGDCYVVSVGNYDATVDAASYTGPGNALEVVSKLDEPTILLFPDAANPDDFDVVNLGIVQKAALKQCGELKDRVTLCDTLQIDADGSDFRDNIGINDLKYGMAYTPWLNVSLSRSIAYRNLLGSIIQKPGAAPFPINDSQLHGGDTDIVALLNVYEAQIDWQNAYAVYIADPTPDQTALNAAFAILDPLVTPVFTEYTNAETAYTAAQTAYQATQNATTRTALQSAYVRLDNAVTSFFGGETGLRNAFGVYKNIVSGLSGALVPMPPSGAVAGIIAYVDRTRGVWKAPANVSLNAVSSPVESFSESELAALNIDVNAGKSINAIRTFTGKGVLVWGARTLAGNDNEWRYVPVRRFYNMVEESVKKACEQFVFEPNDANTWVRVQSMIENFLILQWRDGALQGAKPEHAFFVSVGLGKTMTAQDILEGRLIVEIGMAPVRPAEFLILRFSQKMAES